MTTNFIDTDGSGEGKSLEGGFLVIYFVELLINHCIAVDTKINDF